MHFMETLDSSGSHTATQIHLTLLPNAKTKMEPKIQERFKYLPPKGINQV